MFPLAMYLSNSKAILVYNACGHDIGGFGATRLAHVKFVIHSDLCRYISLF